MHLLNKSLWFPDVAAANADGLLAIGGDLQPERLLLAYCNGIFPWYEPYETIMWWSPNPRCVLFPEQLKISKSMQAVLKKNTFTYAQNSAFETVMQSCGAVNNYKHGSTWIGNEMLHAYCSLHKKGYAISAECWQDGLLVGGLYGVHLGQVFFGESMFSTVSNASKFALLQFVKNNPGIALIDCQFYTPHLGSLGATQIQRQDFIGLLKKYNVPGSVG
jgi:leucyl/phenylalanyl-tRNA---protein transferase